MHPSAQQIDRIASVVTCSYSKQLIRVEGEPGAARQPRRRRVTALVAIDAVAGKSVGGARTEHVIHPEGGADAGHIAGTGGCDPGTALVGGQVAAVCGEALVHGL